MTAEDPSSSLCLLPWLNLSLDVDGTARPCCKYEHQHEGSTYAFANLADTSLEDVWNGEAMARLRADFAAGARPEGCRACWDEEAAGVASFRQTFLDDRRIRARPDTSETIAPPPAALDVKLSNACNLKCRICGPVASSLWLNEELKRLPEGHGERDYLEANKDYFRANKLTHRPDDLATLQRWAAGIESIEMTGGEPMLSKENREIIELICEHGHPESVALTFTTNATIMDERVLAALPRFGELTVSLSIDDIGPRLEYQRAPLRWDEVEANIERYAALAGPNRNIYTNTTVSTLNVWYVPELLAWVRDRYPDERVQVNLNLLHGPRHQCIQVLPPAAKARVHARLLACAADLPPHLAERVRAVADFLVHVDEPDDAAWRRGLVLLRERDEIRGESYEATHPEWHAQLVELGLWDEPEGARRGRRKLVAWLRG